MDKFKNKYGIPSARLHHWDYGSAALYFITICTKNREHYIGDITNGRDAMPCISITLSLNGEKIWHQLFVGLKLGLQKMPD
ncbi:MAG: hypothetical protein IT219_12300 [Bacteroidales bacterium]|nr:hypothetical protein [Bacteroidales bacterium]